MSWLRIDDRFTEHPKVLLLSDAALAFWVKVSCWLQRNPKFAGFIPSALLPEIARKSRAEADDLALQLVNARAGGLYDKGLWVVCEGGFRVHDWDEYQPTPEEAEQRRTQRAEAGRLGGKRSGESRREASRSKNEADASESTKQNQSKREAKTNPVPVPVPVPEVIPRSKADDVDPKDLTGFARDDIPTNVNNPKPHHSDAETLSGPTTCDDSSEWAPTQPRGAQPAESPVSRIEVNPRSRATVMALPIAERSRWMEANKDQADWAQPQTWPEVVEAIQAFYDSAGRAMPRLRHYKQDFAVQAMVSHYAADESVATVVAACRSYPKTESFRRRIAGKRPPSAAWITVEVLRRAADDMADAEATALELAREKVKRESETQTASMIAKVEHLNELRDPSGKDWSRPRPIPLPARGIKALLGGGK